MSTKPTDRFSRVELDRCGEKAVAAAMWPECSRPKPDWELRQLRTVEVAARARFEYDLADAAERSAVLEMIATALAGLDDS